MNKAMLAGYEVLTDLESKISMKETFARDVLIGLSSNPKRIPSKYFYDAEGSRLFQQITDLKEYYLTQCEFEIFHNHKEDIAGILRAESFNLVELGPGDARKTRVLLKHFLDRKLDFHYVPIDISEPALRDLVRNMELEFPGVRVHGLVSEYFNALNWLKNLNHRKNVVLFLGSSIGNFNRDSTRVFLHSLWNSLNANDYALIGFDLKKDIELLLRAYNDSKGVTREFNLNLLRRINRELGGGFDLSRFRHYASYNVFSGAMESYLVSLEKQTVMIQEIGQSFSFDPWEPIHTEYSYKYLESDIAKLAEDTTFSPMTQFYDSRKFFTDVLWRVHKQ
ncbi:L-histidine N(alpha)-methyltransferase [bacterium]|nr:L-histidine N(alpha)-methyltransferase [bacterium]